MLTLERHGVGIVLEDADFGRYVNGDWWFLPTVLRATLPGAKTQGLFGAKARWVNGTEVNPEVSWTQGFDSAFGDRYALQGEGWYDHRKNVGAALPFVVHPGDQLVVTESDLHPAKPTIRRMAVFTCVDTPPPRDSWRPPLCKPALGAPRLADLDVKLLHDLAVRDYPGEVSSSIGLARSIEGVVWDAIPEWLQQYGHAAENCPSYGARIASVWGEAALRLILGPHQGKLPLLIALVQRGLDVWGQAVSAAERGHGAKWMRDGAGHHNGRLLLGAFVAHLFQREHEPMLEHFRAGSPVAWSEQGQFFHVERPIPERGYTQEMVGRADWGAQHRTRPELDLGWVTPEDIPGHLAERLPTPAKQGLLYRQITMPSLWGLVAAVEWLGFQDSLGCSALWEYAALYDRWIDERGWKGTGSQAYAPWTHRGWKWLRELRGGTGWPSTIRSSEESDRR